MAKYRKKPVVIEAWKYPEEARDIPGLYLKTMWAGPESETAVNTYLSPCQDHHWIDGAHVHTLEGPLNVSEGDMVIRGVQGEVYPCKPDIFEATYEKVE